MTSSGVSSRIPMVLMFSARGYLFLSISVKGGAQVHWDKENQFNL